MFFIVADVGCKIEKARAEIKNLTQALKMSENEG